MGFVVPGIFPTNPDGFTEPKFGGSLAVMVANIAYTDTVKNLFTLPAGAVPVFWHVDVVTDFNAGTNNNLDIGIGGDEDYFANDVAIGTQGIFLPTASGAVAGRFGTRLAEETVINATYAQSGTAATQGVANVFLWYFLHGPAYVVD